jgi:hypothetical protein
MYDKWWVDAELNCYGRISTHQLMFSTKKEALNVKIGDTFLV